MGNCCIHKTSDQVVNYSKLGIITIQRKNSFHQSKASNYIKSPKKLARRDSLYQINNENIFKKYEFKEFIEIGINATIRIAYPKNDPTKRYAVKSIEKSKLTSQKIANLSREVEVLSGLDHPNIVKYYETYIDKEYFHIVMEYCSGGDLFERLCEKNHHITEFEVSSIIYRLLSALTYIHSIGIVNNDIRPENILFENKNFSEIKIVDFGLSKKFINEGGNSVLIQNYFTPPEVYERGKYDSKGDIWALGTLGYILLSGSAPFYSNDPLEYFRKLKNEALNFKQEDGWKLISSEAVSLLKKMLKKDPKERPKTSKLLEHPWFDQIREHIVPKKDCEIQISRNLRKLHQFSGILKILMRVIIYEFKYWEIENLKTAFLDFDNNKCGNIKYNQFKKCCLDIFESRKDMNSTLILIDCDDKSVDNFNYKEFIDEAVSKKRLLNRNNYWQAFMSSDETESGLLNILGAHKAINFIGKKISNEKLESLFKDAGFEKDANINFEEFYALIYNYEDC